MALKEEVIGVICSTLEVKADEVKEDLKLYDSIGVDSTEVVELVVTLKKHFDITLETDEVTKFSTPLDIVGIIENKKQNTN